MPVKPTLLSRREVLMNPIILGTNKKALVLPRFQVLAAMLEGKQDVSTGRDCMDICATVDLSPASVRSFLNKLAEEGLVNKTFIPMGHNPMCVGWPNHNEYSLTDAGLRYIHDQLDSWSRTDHFDESLAARMRPHVARISRGKGR